MKNQKSKNQLNVSDELADLFTKVSNISSLIYESEDKNSVVLGQSIYAISTLLNRMRIAYNNNSDLRLDLIERELRFCTDKVKELI